MLRLQPQQVEPILGGNSRVKEASVEAFSMISGGFQGVA